MRLHSGLCEGPTCAYGLCEGVLVFGGVPGGWEALHGTLHRQCQWLPLWQMQVAVECSTAECMMLLLVLKAACLCHSA